MLDICAEPGRTIEERCAALRMDRAREFRARGALDARGLVEQAGQALGGRVKLFQPTAKGVEWASRQGVKVKTFKSGLVHEYILHQVEKAVGRLGPRWRMQRNTDVGRERGLQPDLLVLAPEGRRVVVEVCCNNFEYDAKNILTESRLPGVDHVLAITPDGKSRRELEQAVSGVLQGQPDSPPPKVTSLDAGRCLEGGFDWLGVLNGGLLSLGNPESPAQ